MYYMAVCSTWSPQGGSGVDKAVWVVLIRSHGLVYGACKGGDKEQAVMKQRSSSQLYPADATCQGRCGHHVFTQYWVNSTSAQKVAIGARTGGAAACLPDASLVAVQHEFGFAMHHCTVPSTARYLQVQQQLPTQ